MNTSNTQTQHTHTSPQQPAHAHFSGLTSSALHILAMFFMLLDHLWATIVPGNDWMTCLGRLSFPMFAFLLSEGFFHTSSRARYMRRLFVFALLSEIPFDLIQGGSMFYPFHQNVMFTLLLGLIAISALDRARGKALALINNRLTSTPSGKTPETISAPLRDRIRIRSLLHLLPGILAAAACCLAAQLGMTDYGAMGVATVIVFYLFRGFPCAKLCQFIALLLMNAILFQGWEIHIPVGSFTLAFPQQGFAVASLIPIWLYNGKKGRGGKVFHYICYAFYPVHMLLIYLIYAAM